MNEEEYKKLVSDYFYDLSGKVVNGEVAGICVVALKFDGTSQVDTFGVPGLAIIGAVESAKHHLLTLNANPPIITKVEP